MTKVLVTIEVEDYATWRATYDAHKEKRAEFGGGDGQVYQSADNPNQAVILLDWDNLENAKKFTASPELQEAMKSSGVKQDPAPQIVFLNDEDTG